MSIAFLIFNQGSLQYSKLRGSTALAVLIQKIMLILSKKNKTLCVLCDFAVQKIIAPADIYPLEDRIGWLIHN